MTYGGATGSSGTLSFEKVPGEPPPSGAEGSSMRHVVKVVEGNGRIAGSAELTRRTPPEPREGTPPSQAHAERAVFWEGELAEARAFADLVAISTTAAADRIVELEDLAAKSRADAAAARAEEAKDAEVQP